MNKEINTCKECKSEYYVATSKKENLCVTCAHYLYGEKRCYHRFEGGERCAKCYWNGTFSERIKAIIRRNDKKLQNAKMNIIYVSILLGFALFLTFFRADLGILGIIVCVPFLVRARAYKRRLEKEIPYLN